MTIVLLCLQLGCILFPLLAWLLYLGLPVLCWMRVLRVGTLVFSLILEDSFWHFTIDIEYDISCGFVVYCLYYNELYSFYTQFVEGFYHERILYFVKLFFCIYWDDHMIFIFHSVNVVYHIYWCALVEPYLHPRDKSYLVTMYNPFNMLLSSVC